MEKMLKFILGGIPMIADDMMSYIKSDIVVFGIGVFIFIILHFGLFLEILNGYNAFIGCATSVL